MKKSGIKESNSRTCPRCKGRGVIGKSQYHRGRSFEYKVRDYLKARGWTVWRSYASKGTFDLVANKRGIWVGIQAKNRKSGAYLNPKELNQLVNEYREKSIDYTLFYWSMSEHKQKSLNIPRPINVIHAYTLPGGRKIEWKILTINEDLGLNHWLDAQKLIKTGKL